MNSDTTQQNKKYTICHFSFSLAFVKIRKGKGKVEKGDEWGVEKSERLRRKEIISPKESTLLVIKG